MRSKRQHQGPTFGELLDQRFRNGFGRRGDDHPIKGGPFREASQTIPDDHLDIVVAE